MKKILRSSVNAIPSAMRGWIKHIPGVATLQQLLIRNVLSGEPFEHIINAGPAAGLKFDITLPLDKAIWAGVYEPQFSAAISKAVALGDVCYDVGGYRGYMSGAMALAGASKVIVFEPLPANQRALERLSFLNPGLCIELKCLALGDTDGSMHLRVMADTSMGKLVTSTFQPGVKGIGEIRVAVRTIDSMVTGLEIAPPQVIKIDVEGAEMDVLRGAAEVLRIHRPRIFLEAHSLALEEACSAELARHNYNVRRLELSPVRDEDTRHLIAFAR